MSFAHMKLTRAEPWLVGALLLVSVVTRCWAPLTMSVEHFDEGVYAADALFEALGIGAYPGVQFFAPPLFRRLLMAILMLTDPGQGYVFIVPVLAGVATVALAWWVSRTWFGCTAGLVTLAAAACSDFHVLYSRMLLTDGPACFFWLLSLYAFRCAVESGRWNWLLLAGGSIAATWATKYTGWATLANCVAAVTIATLVSRQTNGLFRPLVRTVVVAAFAIVCWSPVWYGLQESGGYAAVARNHAGYLARPESWWSNLETQIQMVKYFDSPLGTFGLVLSGWIGGVCFTWNDRTWVRILAVSAVAMLVAAVGVSVGVIALGFLGASRVIIRGYRDGEFSDLLVGALLLVWLAGIGISLGFYHPYPRLSLPALVAGWVSLGAFVSARFHGFERRDQGTESSRDPGRRSVRTACLLAAGLCLGGGLSGSLNVRGAAWEDRTGLAQAVFELTPPRETVGDGLLLTFGQPAATFHLTAGGYAVAPISSWTQANALGGATRPIWLIVGRRTLDQAVHEFSIDADEWPFDEVAAVRYVPSSVLLCNLDPSLSWEAGRSADVETQLTEELVLLRADGEWDRE